MLKILPLTPEDCISIIKWNEGKDTDYLIQWSGLTQFEYPITVEQIIDKSNDKKNVFYKIVLDSQIIGSISLLFAENGIVYVCRFIIIDEMKGKGYGTEALKSLASIAFNEFHLQQLKLGVYIYNVSAIRCYEKAGFLVESIYIHEKNTKWNSYTMCLDKDRFFKILDSKI